MSSSHLLDPFIINLFGKEGKSFLDIACGFGKWGYLLKISHLPPSFVVGGDMDGEALRFTSANGAYQGVMFFDARFLPLRNNTIDNVLALEVVEHLEKEEARKILRESERVAKERVIVSTPLLGGLYWFSPEYHVSKWTPNDLTKLGYIVRGVGFSLFGRWSTKKLAYALGPLAYYFPWLSHIILGWKNLSEIPDNQE